MAAEQKARVTYDNLLRLIDDRDVCDVLKFLREREIVHYQRFGEAKRAASYRPWQGRILNTFAAKNPLWLIILHFS